MLFTSLSFFLFLGAALAGFALLPGRWRGLWLLAASLVFYASFGATNLVFLLVIALAAWLTGLGITTAATNLMRRVSLAFGLVVILGSLFALKFHDFLAGELERALGGGLDLPRLGVTAPVGFSFYAFMAAAYVIDVHRGACEGERNFGRLVLY